MADDLVDNATSEEEIMTWVSKLDRYLDFFYADAHQGTPADLDHLIESEFPPTARSALKLLPTDILPGEPLYLLINGFQMDAQFNVSREDKFPIEDEKDLHSYGRRVAGTVGELCVALITHHCGNHLKVWQVKALLDSAREMGIALQYVNIARDIVVDAKIGRVYLPTSWLADVGMKPDMVIRDPMHPGVAQLRTRLLDRAFEMYRHSRPVMRWLPNSARGPMVVAVENYMEIGRVLREKGSWDVLDGRRATVPARRRLWVAFKALMSA